MAYAQLRVRRATSPEAGRGASPYPVILDSGDRARVVTVTFSRVPEVGDRFELDGSVWEVAHPRDFTRGLVARIVTPGSSVH